MKRFNRLFQDAERLAPPPDLWKRIEAKADPARGSRLAGPGLPDRVPDGAVFWGAPAMRAAAAVVLAVGVLGLGMLLQKRTGGSAVYATSAPAAREGSAAEAGRDPELVDPELLGWHADLGEVDDEVVEAEEAGEAEEML